MVAHPCRILVTFACVSILLLAACSSRPVLIAKNATVPVGVDLSGNWKLRQDANTRGKSSVADEPGIRISRNRPFRERPSKSKKGTSAHVFLETGESLKVTQTQFGLFISYDRSVVEEYTFGENREVKIGPIAAQRVSGWLASAFVVETLDDNGTVLYETWHLEEDGTVLVRDIRLANGENETFKRRERFDRS